MPWPAILNVVEPPASTGLRGALDRILTALGIDRKQTPGHQKAAFAIAFIGLAAKMAKADGVAVSVEEAAFERLFTVAPEERDNVLRLYSLAKADIGGYEQYAAKIKTLLADEPQMLAAVLECLFVIAAADGIMHAGEGAFLTRVSEIFGIDAEAYQRMRRLFVADARDPYAILEVGHDADDATVRARYMALVKENHPDALVARGVPPEFHAVAARKIAVINAAYDAIKAERARRRRA